MAKQRTLTPSFLVRVQVPQHGKRLTFVSRFCFNRIERISPYEWVYAAVQLGWIDPFFLCDQQQVKMMLFV